MIADFIVYEDTRKPAISATLKEAGVAVDLTGATVRFRMRLATGGALKVDALASIVSATAGTVRYDWAAADLDTAGVFRGWWHVTFSDATTAQFPSRKTYVIDVKAAA